MFTKQFDTPEEVNTRYQLEKRVRRKGQLRGRLRGSGQGDRGQVRNRSLCFNQCLLLLLLSTGLHVARVDHDLLLSRSWSPLPRSVLVALLHQHCVPRSKYRI
jgi:hypothetical protein